MTKRLCLITLLLSLVLTSCGGGGNGNNNGNGTTSTYGLYNSAFISASQFVNSLNYTDGTNGTYVELYTDETYRSQIAGQDDWFVIWDAFQGEHKAVSLQYIRAIEYYDYMSDNDSLASEFRAIETDDINAGNYFGDTYGDDYEVVYQYEDEFGIYYGGGNSGYEYEDEAETTDLILLAAEEEQKYFYTHAAALSVEYNIGIETAMGLVTLGSKVEAMTKKGSLSLSDISKLSNDIEHMTGASMTDLIQAGTDKEARNKLVQSVASKVGTTQSAIEQKFLPGLLGIEL